MAEREVGFKINLNPGVAALKAQMQGVISLSKNTSLQLQQIEEQHQLRMKALSEKEKLAYVNVSKGRVTEYRSALRAIEQEEERHSLRMRQAAERDILRQKQQQIPNMLRAASQGAFFAGQSNMGRGLRVGAELAEGTEGIAAMAAVALPAAIALGGLMVATKLVEVGFGALQKTSMELVGAIAEIGGAKGIQQMFVESVSNEKLARQAAFAVAPGQRLSSNELMSRSGALAEDIQAGAFSREDYLKAYKKIGIETGTQAGVSHDMMSFLGRLALVGGTDLSETSSVYSKIVKQNRNLSPNEIKAMLITGHAIGQTGSFNIEELARAPRLTALESRLAGSDVNKLTSLMTVGTLIKEGGADSLSQSGSWLRTLMQKATMAPELFQFKGGLISNFPEAIKQLVTMNPNLINSHLRKGLSGSAITALRSAVSERAGEQAAAKAMLDWLRANR